MREQTKREVVSRCGNTRLDPNCSLPHLIEQARRAIGEDPNLLDTEAIIRLNKGDIDGARRLLEEITTVAPDAVAYFHLAQVERSAKRDIEMRFACKRANELGLKREDLHPLERPAFDQFEGELKQ